MRDHGAVSVGARVRDALQGLGERADLVQLDEDRVRHALLDPAIQPLDVGAEEIVADELHARGQRFGELRPSAQTAPARPSSDDTNRIRAIPAFDSATLFSHELLPAAPFLEDEIPPLVSSDPARSDATAT